MGPIHVNIEHCLLHFDAVAAEAITNNAGFLSDIPIAKSTFDSLAEILLLYISYNTNEHAFAITYQPHAPLRTGPIANPRRTAHTCHRGR